MKKKILVIDDEEMVLEIIRKMIPPNGYEVYVCGTAQQAVEFVRRLLPDLIISDYDLSELSNGVDLVLGIRRAIKKEIPVIIMSGSPQNHQKAVANKFEFIQKPFDGMELVELVTRTIRASQINPGLKMNN